MQLYLDLFRVLLAFTSNARGSGEGAVCFNQFSRFNVSNCGVCVCVCVCVCVNHIIDVCLYAYLYAQCPGGYV